MHSLDPFIQSATAKPLIIQSVLFVFPIVSTKSERAVREKKEGESLGDNEVQFDGFCHSSCQFFSLSNWILIGRGVRAGGSMADSQTRGGNQSGKKRAVFQ